MPVQPTRISDLLEKSVLPNAFYQVPLVMQSKIALETLNETHISALYEWKLTEEDPHFYTCRPVPQDILSFEEYRDRVCKRTSSDSNQDFIVKLVNTGEILGHLFSFDYNSRNISTEIGYYFPRQNRGRGFGKIALQALCKHLFTGQNYNKLYATTGEFNIASIRTLEFCGFKLDGCNREHYWIADKKYHQLVYSILRADWDALGDKHDQ